MKRVLVIGCPGSGKSTLARALAERTGLPLFYLDQMYWNGDKTTVEREVFLSRLEAALAEDAWIIDGNYASTMERRMAVCDTVLFLDYPTDICLAGVLARQGAARPDMPWVENVGEEDEAFFAFIREYRERSRPGVLVLLEKYKEKDIHVFQSRDAADAWLTSL